MDVKRTQGIIFGNRTTAASRAVNTEAVKTRLAQELASYGGYAANIKRLTLKNDQPAVKVRLTFDGENFAQPIIVKRAKAKKQPNFVQAVVDKVRPKVESDSKARNLFEQIA